MVYSPFDIRISVGRDVPIHLSGGLIEMHFHFFVMVFRSASDLTLVRLRSHGHTVVSFTHFSGTLQTVEDRLIRCASDPLREEDMTSLGYLAVHSKGTPVATPVFYAYGHGRTWIAARRDTRKVAALRDDARASLLSRSTRGWTLTLGRVRVLDVRRPSLSLGAFIDGVAATGGLLSLTAENAVAMSHLWRRDPTLLFDVARAAKVVLCFHPEETLRVTSVPRTPTLAFTSLWANYPVGLPARRRIDGSIAVATGPFGRPRAPDSPASLTSLVDTGRTIRSSGEVVLGFASHEASDRITFRNVSRTTWTGARLSD